MKKKTGFDTALALYIHDAIVPFFVLYFLPECWYLYEIPLKDILFK